VLGKVRDWLAFGLGAFVLQAFCVASAQEAEVVPAPTISSISTDAKAPCPTDTRCVIVAEVFLNIHSGPGRGYPIVHVAGRDEQIEVLKRRTDWFYVRTSRQIEGWAPRDQILATRETTGELIDIHEPSRSDYTTRRWEGGVFVGRLETASLIAIYGGYGVSDHLTAELTLTGAAGPLAATYAATLGLNHTFAPEWLVSPYVGLGTGIISISPRSTLVQADDRNDQVGYVTAGVRAYLARRFTVRFEYRGNVVFTSRNENEEIDEWKLGFAFFF
jgi:Bacterial SH3 domain